ncbi:MAG: mannose-1-phosphate guanylyltransferase/mannose-6-phosphate isomerase [Chromatiales bacterium]|nr:mannose-1-phosphate guanylyltransferase/mannose-6-phosphate isomerase [Chromatiales bacterium]
MDAITPVILCGGSGTRLWPASRTERPKQFLQLVGEETLLQKSVARLRDCPLATAVPVVVCNSDHRFLVAEQLRQLGDPAVIIVEPGARGTAPAAAVAALHTLDVRGVGEPPPILLIAPSDHTFTDPAALLEAFEIGRGAAAEGRIVTFGVVPDRPHTGYGYIEATVGSDSSAPIRSFVEKPDLERASEMVRSGRYYWNAGMFMVRADTYLAALRRHSPAVAAACRDSMARATSTGDFVLPEPEAFLASPSESIDCGVMEHTDLGVMVPLAAGWSDVGTWAALYDVAPKDVAANAVSGDVLTLDCEGSYLRSHDRLLAAVGVKDLIVVESTDAVLVARRDRSQDVKALVDRLSRDGRPEARSHRQVSRPWGHYEVVDVGEGFQVKRLVVEPGARLSLQRHARRAEHWVVVRGVARVTRDAETFDLEANQATYIAVGCVHRIENPGSEPVHIVEVQYGEYLGEDDIVRYEDDHGRKGTTD